MAMADFQLTYEVCPIILTGGVAANMPGGMMPVLNLLQPGAFGSGGDSEDNGPDAYVAAFRPLPGSTLFDAAVATYPLANRVVAANAIIMEPLKVSLHMTAPAPSINGAYELKSSVFSQLQQTLQQHVAAGGTFTVATPAYTYTDCLLTALRDVSGGGGGEQLQVQTEWQWDFIQPLITQAAATAAQNNLMSKISSGTQVAGDPPTWSGLGNTPGVPPSTVAGSITPDASNVGGVLSALGGASPLAPAVSSGLTAFGLSGATSVASELGLGVGS